MTFNLNNKMNYSLALVLFSFVGFTFAETCDDINEEYKDCGTACSITCADQREDRPCIKMCVSGCFCKEPYIRDELTGECVTRNQCTPTCKDPNEAFNECGTACPTTCANMNQTERVCTLQCVPACFCKEPYVRDETTGKCVLRDQCLTKQICSNPNEVYNSCGTDCPLTCRNFANPAKICDRMCRVGCFCVEPYVRDESSGKCVTTKDCSK